MGIEYHNPKLKDNRIGSFFQKEYYKIDMVGWTRTEEYENAGKNAPLNKHAWILDFAIEHENNYRDWSDEVIKLMNIDCPLRVVIGYVNREDLCDEGALNYMNEMLSKLYINMRPKIHQNDEFAIILGNKNAKRTITKSLDYRCYKVYFENGKFDYRQV